MFGICSFLYVCSPNLCQNSFDAIGFFSKSRWGRTFHLVR